MTTRYSRTYTKIMANWPRPINVESAMAANWTRRQSILSLLAIEAATADSIRMNLRPTVSRRTVASDVTWLARTFPAQVRKQRGSDARTVIWSLDGLPPVLLPHGAAALTHDELAAIIAARGLLRAPDVKHPGWERPSSPYAGDLSAALHGLLERLGLGEQARHIAPAAIGASRFGIAPEPPGALATLQRAIVTGQAARFAYRNRAGTQHACHVWPIRLVLIKGEWFCFAWSGRVKQYALARVVSRSPVVTIDARLPPGAPSRPPHDVVDAALASGFHATGSDDPGQRVRLVLAISPAAWPSIADRTWGSGQHIHDAPEDLPHGWRRLSFLTTGLTEARHWVLSFGTTVRAEAPAALTEWLYEQTQAMVSVLSHMRATQPASVDVTMSPTTTPR